jgi:hypothetical protein
LLAFVFGIVRPFAQAVAWNAQLSSHDSCRLVSVLQQSAARRWSRSIA